MVGPFKFLFADSTILLLPLKNRYYILQRHYRLLLLQGKKTYGTKFKPGRVKISNLICWNFIQSKNT